jgi:hypothetical protein
LSDWVCSCAQTDKRYLSAVGYDPTGQTANAKASTVIWEGAGRSSARFEQIVIDHIRPKSDAVSVWLRGANKDVGDATFAVDFDDFVLEEAGQ